MNPVHCARAWYIVSANVKVDTLVSVHGVISDYGVNTVFHSRSLVSCARVDAVDSRQETQLCSDSDLAKYSMTRSTARPLCDS